MNKVPDSERIRFENLMRGQSERFGLTSEDYLRKVWYHEQAARLGEYVAMLLLHQLLELGKDASEGAQSRVTTA